MSPDPLPIHTERLTLRRLAESDVPGLSAYRGDPEVARYQGWGSSYSEAQAMELVQEMVERTLGQPGWFQVGVAERASGLLVGDLGLNAFSPGQAEIGFTLARSVWGRGYAREAAHALLELCFGALGWHRVVAGTDPRNGRAATVLRRLGFRHEGQLLESYFDGLAWLDEDRYALLAREWPRHSPAS